jgi:hypothetical protein
MAEQRLLSGDALQDLKPAELAALVRKVFTGMPRSSVLPQMKKVHPAIQERIFKNQAFAREVLQVSQKQNKSFTNAKSMSQFISDWEAKAKFRRQREHRIECQDDDPMPDDCIDSTLLIPINGTFVNEKAVREAAKDRAKLVDLVRKISLLDTETIKAISTEQLVEMMTNMICTMRRNWDTRRAAEDVDSGERLVSHQIFHAVPPRPCATRGRGNMCHLGQRLIDDEPISQTC